MTNQQFKKAAELQNSINFSIGLLNGFQSSIESIENIENEHTVKSIAEILRMYLTYPDFKEFTLQWLREMKQRAETDINEKTELFKNL